MLGSGNGKVSPSVYDYYVVEDDLDDVADDDQPIDFSKRYADLESDDAAKSGGKKRLRSSTPSVNSEPTICKQPCEDDLRVYCIEGTPLLISSSSSMCDLRDVEISDSALSKRAADIKFFAEQLKPSVVSEEQNKSKENTEFKESGNQEETREEESQPIFEEDEKSSKVSSPLMFSRSSSISSLNSFEQHSFVDDGQSSVSIFSNLTSGIISPSEIPDSPGEAMSPFIHKNKQPEFKFPSCDDKENAFDSKINMDVEYGNMPADDIKIFNVEGDCSSMSSFSELSIPSSDHMSVTLDCDIDKNITNVEKEKIKIRCVKTLAPVENSNTDFSLKHENAPDSKNSTSVECKDNKGLSVVEEYEEPFKSRTFSMPRNFSARELTPNESNVKKETNVDTKIDGEKPVTSLTAEDYCDSDEDEELLNQYIMLGMPDKNSQSQSNTDISFKQSQSQFNSDIKPCQSPQNSECYNSLSGSDDEANALLEDCIRNGKSNVNYSCIDKEEQMSNTRNSEKISEEFVSESDEEADALLAECIQSGKQHSSSETHQSNKTAFAQESETSKYSAKENSSHMQYKESFFEKETAITTKKYGETGKLKKQCNTEKLKKMSNVCSHTARSSKHRVTNTVPTCKMKQNLSDIHKPCDLSLKGSFLSQNEEKKIKQTDSGSDDEELIVQCIKSGMPEKKVCNQSQWDSHNLFRASQLQSRSKNHYPSPNSKNYLNHTRCNQSVKQLAKDHFKLLNDSGLERRLKAVDSNFEDDKQFYDQSIKFGISDKKPNSQPQFNSYTSSQTFHNGTSLIVNYGYLESHTESTVSTSRRISSVSQSRTAHTMLKEGHLQQRSKSQPQSSPFFPKSIFCQSGKQVWKENANHWNKYHVKKEEKCKLDEDLEDEDNLYNECIQSGLPSQHINNSNKFKGWKNKNLQCYDANLGFRDIHPDGTSDDDEDDYILRDCINAGKPKQSSEIEGAKQKCNQNKDLNCLPSRSNLLLENKSSTHVSTHARKIQSLNCSASKKTWTTNFGDDYSTTAIEEAPCIYKTEDTPVLSPTASISDLSCLSFNDEKSTSQNHLNNSRNSDCSFDSSDDEELLLQCIQSGLPVAERAFA